MLRKLIAFAILVVTVVSCTNEEVVDDYSAADKATIEKYLADNNLTAQAKSTPSGLYYVIVNPGGAVHPKYNSTVTAFYRGYLTDGKIFDQTPYTTGKPLTFSLLNVIDGWQEGLQLIGARSNGVNGKIKLLIPSRLGYGSTVKSEIPANSVLIFDIELVEFY